MGFLNPVPTDAERSYASHMTEDWRKRAARLMVEQGLTMKALSLRAGMSAATVHTWFRGAGGSRAVSPSIDNFIAIAEALGVSPEYLLTGGEAPRFLVPVVGIASAGEGWTAQPDTSADPLEMEIGDGDPVAIQVRGDSMSPVYRNGDTLVCHRRGGRYADNLIGKDCVVLTATGEGYVKILRRGSRPGVYALKSYNPTFEDIEDVALRWVAPVIWIKRG